MFRFTSFRLHPPGKTLCRIGHDVIMQVAQRDDAAVEPQAELQIGRCKVRNLRFDSVSIGIRVFKNGGLGVKASGDTISTVGKGKITVCRRLRRGIDRLK